MGSVRLDLDDTVAAIRSGDRRVLSQAITLIESRRAEDALLAQDLLGRLIPYTGKAQRVGISGVPGVGKSTLIDALGSHLVEQGLSVAVLAVDPSSSISGGSILGDKTQMRRLARSDNAYIRPSPSAQSLGGVGRRTREAMLVCEAAGFDVVFVETVGVGQSETMVANMVDCFVVLMLPGGGDELQGIKKGILELADLVVVNKADEDNMDRARLAVAEYSAALRIARRSSEGWHPRALRISARTGDGIQELWALIQEHRRLLLQDHVLQDKRQRQRVHWMWSRIEERLLTGFRGHPGVGERLAQIEAEVLAGRVTPDHAASELLAIFEG